MRQKLALALGLAVVGGIVRVLLGRRRGPGPVAADPRAVELRQKLAASRGKEPAPEPPPAPVEELGVDEARARVHEQGRAAVEEMRRAGL